METFLLIFISMRYVCMCRYHNNVLNHSDVRVASLRLSFSSNISRAVVSSLVSDFQCCVLFRTLKLVIVTSLLGLTPMEFYSCPSAHYIVRVIDHTKSTTPSGSPQNFQKERGSPLCYELEIEILSTTGSMR